MRDLTEEGKIPFAKGHLLMSQTKELQENIGEGPNACIGVAGNGHPLTPVSTAGYCLLPGSPLDHLDAAHNIDPENSSTTFHLARKLFDDGQYEKAVKKYSEAIDANPENSNAYYNRGLALKYVAHQEPHVISYKRAVADIQKYIEMAKPQGNDKAEAYYQLAQCYFEMFQKTGAPEHLREAKKFISRAQGANEDDRDDIRKLYSEIYDD